MEDRTNHIDAEDNEVLYSLDDNGNMLSIKDGNKNVSSYIYDELNRPTEKTNPEGDKSFVEYDKDGRVKKVTDEEKAETIYEYDGNGNIKSIEDALGNVTLMEYDEMNRVTKVTDAREGETVYTYTETGLIETVRNAEGAVSSYEYDANGNLLNDTNGEKESITYTYDALNRVTEVKDPLGNTEGFTYDKKGQILTSKDKNGNETTYTYDKNGNVIETVDALGGISLFAYNAAGLITKATLNRIDTQDNVDEQEVTIYEYNGNGLVKKTINAASGSAIFVYDGNSNLIQKTDEQGFVTEYSYNRLDLVKDINYNNGKKANFAYNKVGELVKMADWNGTTSFEVDLLKRITKVTDHKGKVVEYGYDETSNNVAIKYPDSTVTSYTYDLIGQMKTVTEPGAKVTEYTYDLAGRLATMLYPNDWEEFYIYDDAGRLLDVKDTSPDNKTAKSMKHSYTYDANGNILSEFIRAKGTGSVKEDLRYVYDKLDRVTKAYESFGNKTRVYQYDSVGNLTYETGDNGNKAVDFKYNSMNQQVKKIVDGKDSFTLTYDDRGNLLKEVDDKKNAVQAEYVYDETNHMVSGTNDIGEKSDYIYNGLGALVSNVWTIKKNAYGYHDVQPNEVVDGEVVVNAATGEKDKKEKKPAEEVLASATLNQTSTVVKNFVIDYTRGLFDVLQETETQGLTYRYGYGLQRLSANVSPITAGDGNLGENGAMKLYYHQDYLGTTDYLTSDKTGKIASWTMYNEWGEITHNSILKCGVREIDLVKNFTGYEYDQVLGIYFAKNRMYDPEARRFTQIDPIKDGLNWYEYVGSNPVNWVDPLGLSYVIGRIGFAEDGFEVVYEFIPQNALTTFELMLASFIPGGGLVELIGEAVAGVKKPSSVWLYDTGITVKDELVGATLEAILKAMGYASKVGTVYTAVLSTNNALLVYSTYQSDVLLFSLLKKIKRETSSTTSLLEILNLQKNSERFLKTNSSYFGRFYLGLGSLYEMHLAVAAAKDDTERTNLIKGYLSTYSDRLNDAAARARTGKTAIGGKLEILRVKLWEYAKWLDLDSSDSIFGKLRTAIGMEQPTED